jgi:hypothetical protein
MTLSKVHTLIKVTVLFCAMAYGICVHEYDRDLFYGHSGLIYIYIYICFVGKTLKSLTTMKRYCTSKHDLDWLCTRLSWD